MEMFTIFEKRPVEGGRLTTQWRKTPIPCTNEMNDLKQAMRDFKKRFPERQFKIAHEERYPPLTIPIVGRARMVA